MKTPIISVSSKRNAAMYSLTRMVTPQLAAIVNGIRNVVSITKSTEMPSTPIL